MASSSLHDAARVIKLLEGKLDAAREKIQAARDKRRESIAIVGFAARTPFESLGLTLWGGLSKGVDASSEIPKDRWDPDALHAAGPQAADKPSSRRGSFLSNVREFDAAFFAIAPVEARTMDPQQRLVLEMAWEALANASLPLDLVQRLKTGVFLGTCSLDYGVLAADAAERSNEEESTYFATGTAPAVIAARVSYALGLTGPSLMVDTACSSSLVAVHLACDSLRTRTADVALAGGVSMMLSHHQHMMLARMGALSADGRCRTFDAKGAGFGRGEGCGIVVLKRLSDALRDGDRVLALVRGSAVNQDGRSDGLTAPNGLAQQAVVRTALEFAQIAPVDVQYIEAHGTGTVLGDPIEVHALGEVFAAHAQTTPLMIGSVKSNIGHLEGAAGVAGLAKVIASIQHRELPPSLHVETPNSYIAWDQIPVRIQTTLGPWPSPHKELVAGVSAFSVGGTNAHVVVSEAPREALETWSEADRLSRETEALPLCVSAKTPEALRAYAKRFAEYLSRPFEDGATWRDVAFTANARQTHLEHRLMVVGRNAADWSKKLEAFSNGDTQRCLSGTASEQRDHVVFVYAGQGSQWLGMGRSLLETSAVFREQIERCEVALKPFVDWSLKEQLLADESSSRLSEVNVSQPVLFAFQVALTAVWESQGVVPNAVVGHSMGEVAAAFVAGALTLEDAARVICVRSKLLNRVRGRGAMATIDLPLAECEAELAPYGGKLSVAASNSPRLTVVSGDAEAVATLVDTLTKRDVGCRPAISDVAGHSSQMDELEEELVRQLSELRPKEPTLRFVSTVVDSKTTPSFDAAYWWSNMRKPVRLSQIVGELLAEGHEFFVEMSPRPLLVLGVSESIQASRKTAFVIPSLRRTKSEAVTILEALGELHVAGYPVDWKKVFAVRGRAVTLPSYPWQRQRYWLPSSKKKNTQSRDSKWALVHRHYASSEQTGKHVFEVDLDISEGAHSYLVDHKVQGVVWLPAAAYLEMALEAATVAFEGKVASVEALELSEAMTLNHQESTHVQLVLQPEHEESYSFRVASRTSDASDAPWTKHASGRLLITTERDRAPRTTLGEVQKRCTRAVDVNSVYDELEAAGAIYGPSFRGIEEGWGGDGEAISKLQELAKLTEHASGYVMHPAVLDAAFQTLALTRPLEDETYVPSTVGRLRVHTKATPRWAYVKERPATGSGITADVLVFDEKGRVAWEVEELHAIPLGKKRDKLDDMVLEIAWRPSASKGPDTAKTTWLVLSDEGGIGAGLRSWLEARGGQVVTVSRATGYAKKDATDYEVDPSSPQSMTQLLKEAYGSSGPTRVVSLFALDARATSESPLNETIMQRAQELTLSSTLALTQALALAQPAWNAPARLFLVTRGCQPAMGSRDVVSPEQALAWGFGATLAHEMAELKTTLVDIEAGTTPESLARALSEADDETRVALRGNDRLVARLTHHSRPKASLGGRRPLTVDAEQGYALSVLEPGILDSLTLQPADIPKPGRDEVVVRTRASALNFHDVLAAMNVAHGDAGQRPLIGSDCAGVVHAVGAGVDTLRVGDEVVALSFSALDSHVVVPSALVVKKPAALSFEQAAALPTAVATVLHSLDNAARLQKEETILIHAATGGVGLAAVQYAKHIGAEIYATAGSEAKRAYLRSLGVKYVYDSRTLAWADEVMRDTGGRGIDVVLNSLTGDALRKGISVLAPFGRFIEIGRKDIYENTALGLYGLRNNITVVTVDLGKMAVARSAGLSALLAKTFRLIDDEILEPLPVETFPISRVADAFDQLARARHIGKVVVSAEDSVMVRDPARSDQVAPDKTYLITGGFGGLGLVIARRLAKLGAKHLALLGRSGPSSEDAKTAVREFEASGVRVYVVRADLANASAMRDAFAELARSAPPVAGLIHSAAVLDDATLTTLTADRIGPVLGPKVTGTLVLEDVLRDAESRVYFSSMAGVLGSPGQAHYAAANAFLDSFAHHLRGRAKHALSLAWGAWAEVGGAVRKVVQDNLARQGLAMIVPDEGAELFERLLSSTSAQLGVLPVDFRQWRQANPQLADMPLIRDMTIARTAEANSNLIERLRTAPTPDDRLNLLLDYVRSAVAGVVRIEPEALQSTVPFKQLGFDSLMTVNLKNLIERDLSVSITSATLFSHPTIERLAAHIAEKFASSEAKAPPAPARVKVQVAEPKVEVRATSALAAKMQLIEKELEDD